MFDKTGEAIPFYFILSLIIIAIVMLLRSIFLPICPPLESLETDAHILKRIIIDPGHGGKDSGAVSVTGSLEKHLNLDISLTMREVLHILGYEVIMTRDSDIELTHEGGGTRKMQDLMGRLQLSNDNPDAIFVSIHQNKFAEEKYYGLQVYYSQNNSLSHGIADSVRSAVRAFICPDNDRGLKRSDSSIFLLHKIKAPAVLIECGFLSNRREAELLDSVEYRVKLSSVIAVAISNSYERQAYEN